MRYSIDLDINNSKVLSFYVSTFPPTKKEKQPELGTFEWWISGLMLDPLFFKLFDLEIK